MTIFPDFEEELRTVARRSSGAVSNSRARQQPHLARWKRASRAVPVAVSIIVVVGVAAAVLSVRARDGSSGPGHAATWHALDWSPSTLTLLRRAQTAKDRGLPLLVRRATQLGGLNRRIVESFLNGAIPASTRYAQTLPDGREVFLTRIHDPHVHQPLLSLWIIAPDGNRRDGQPIMHATFGLPNNRIARIQTLLGPSCQENSTGASTANGVTDWQIVPDGISRIRWQFSESSHGRKPLTVNVPVHNNTAVVTIPDLSSCVEPSAITVYALSGRIITRSPTR